MTIRLKEGQKLGQPPLHHQQCTWLEVRVHELNVSFVIEPVMLDYLDTIRKRP
jgi:hypothetical protein